jgi:hypothetical protein
MKHLLAPVLAVALTGLAPFGSAVADEPASRAERPRSTFRLDYVLSEVEAGKRTNERTFSMTVNEGSHGQLRSGSRVPVGVGDEAIRYQDVGLKLGGRVLERDGDLTLETDLELSSYAVEASEGPAKGNPVVRTVTQSLSSRPAPGKPAVLSTLDDPAGRGRLQLEVTVTRLR